MKNFISKYKTYIAISFIAIVILVGAQYFSNKRSESLNQISTNTGLPTPTPSNFTPPPYSQPPLTSQGQVDIDSPSVKTAVDTKEKLSKSLPIYIKDYKTSNGITTTLNVYTLPEDPNYLIHIDIYGIGFEDKNINNNPNTQAFIDAFNEIKRLLSQKGVDIHNVYFIFGQRSYIQETANLWIKSFGLL